MSRLPQGHFGYLDIIAPELASELRIVIHGIRAIDWKLFDVAERVGSEKIGTFYWEQIRIVIGKNKLRGEREGCHQKVVLSELVIESINIVM